MQDLTAQVPERLQPKRWEIGVSRRQQISHVAATLFFVVYAITTLIPFYMLFVRTFVGTKEATDLHLWIPPAEEVNLDSGIGNLAVFYNLDLAKVKEDMGIPPTEYLSPTWTLRQVAQEFNIPEEKMRDYFAPFGRYNGWIVLFSRGRLWLPIFRTLLITVASLVGINLLSIMTGYGLAGLRRKDQMLIYNFYLLQMVIPPMLIILPQFLIIQRLIGLLPNSDTPGITRFAGQLMAVVLINIKGGALSTMIFTSYISSLPIEMEEAAEIDGASRLQYIRYVLLPLLKVPIAALTVIMLPLFWNQFLEPYIYLDPDNTTLLPLIQNFTGQYTTNFQVTFTGVFISILPLVIVYLIFRKWFIRGVMSGAVKG